jgi:hypothetical protein
MMHQQIERSFIVVQTSGGTHCSIVTLVCGNMLSVLYDCPG